MSIDYRAQAHCPHQTLEHLEQVSQGCLIEVLRHSHERAVAYYLKAWAVAALELLHFHKAWQAFFLTCLLYSLAPPLKSVK